MTNLLAIAMQIDDAIAAEEGAARLLADQLIETNSLGEDLGRYRAEVDEAVESYRKAKARRTKLAEEFHAAAESNSHKGGA